MERAEIKWRKRKKPGSEGIFSLCFLATMMGAALLYYALFSMMDGNLKPK
jgi:hypothetical protein